MRNRQRELVRLIYREVGKCRQRSDFPDHYKMRVQIEVEFGRLLMPGNIGQFWQYESRRHDSYKNQESLGSLELEQKVLKD